MSRMPKTLLAVVAVGLLVGCNSYNRPTTQIGYWPDYEEEKSLNDRVLNTRSNSQIASSNANAPIPGASTYISPAPPPSNFELVSPAPAPVPAPAPPVFAPAPAPPTIFVQPAPRSAPIVLPSGPAPAPAARASTYTVKRGDSLWKIAKNHYGNALRWKEIAAANPSVNPDRLKLGQKLRLPIIGRNSPIAGAAAAARPANAAIEDQATFK